MGPASMSTLFGVLLEVLPGRPHVARAALNHAAQVRGAVVHARRAAGLVLQQMFNLLSNQRREVRVNLAQLALGSVWHLHVDYFHDSRVIPFCHNGTPRNSPRHKISAIFWAEDTKR